MGMRHLMFCRFGFLLLSAAALVLNGCVNTPPYVYHYIPGRTATLDNGYAVSPPAAPFLVRQAIDAGNELIGKPYQYGGGHKNFSDTAYDCSGAVSFVLHSIGRMNTPTPSKELRSYAEAGPGRWITVYASRGHAFLVVAGLRFDTGYANGDHGPKWLTRSRPADDFVMRHPYGL
jgi:cell wall-associated NlpC family hydrolase